MTGALNLAPETTFWHPESFSGLELERVQSAAQPLAPQLLSDHCLSLCVRGPATARYQGVTHTLQDTTFGSYAAGGIFSAAPLNGGRWSYQTLRLSPELMAHLADAAGQALTPTAPIPASSAANRHLGGLFREAFSSFEEDAPSAVQEEKLVTLTRTLLSHQAGPVRATRVTPRAEAAVEKVRMYLAETLYSPVSLEQVADHAQMSKFHLSKLFKHVMGLSPHAYGMSLRVHEAKRALRRLEPLAQVAFDLGFSDQAHFTRTFKRYVGVTPGQYQAGSVSV